MGESQIFTCDQLSTTSIAPGLTACDNPAQLKQRKTI